MGGASLSFLFFYSSIYQMFGFDTPRGIKWSSAATVNGHSRWTELFDCPDWEKSDKNREA